MQISNEAPVSPQDTQVRLGLDSDSPSSSYPQSSYPQSSYSQSSSVFLRGFELCVQFIFRSRSKRISKRVKAFLAAAFLVAVPVFIQAPLVRLWPGVSLCLTPLFLVWGWKLLQKPSAQLWGDLVIGFSWTWLAGAIYWGWFRWDPYVHLPIESIGLPIVLVLLHQRKAKIGNYFYLGSLLGTAITDLYFYCVGLIPYWLCW